MSDLDTPTVPGPAAPSEPLLSVGTITAVVTTGLALLVAFGLDMSDDRQSAILGVVAVVAPLIVAAIGRRVVFAPSTVREIVIQDRADRGVVDPPLATAPREAIRPGYDPQHD